MKRILIFALLLSTSVASAQVRVNVGQIKTVPVFMADTTDTTGNTGKTGLAPLTCRVSINGTDGACGGTSAEDSAGNQPGKYTYTPAAGEVASEGTTTYYFTKSGAYPARGWIDVQATQNVNVLKWTGTNVATPDSAGYVKSTLKSGTGAGEVNINNGRLFISAGGIPQDGYVERGTATSVAAGSITLATGDLFGTNVLRYNNSIYITAADTGAGQVACICGNTNANPSVVTLCSNWDITPTGTVKYDITASPNCRGDIVQTAADKVWGSTTRNLTDKAGFSLATTQTFNNTGTWTGNVAGSVSSVTSPVTVGTNSDKTGYLIAGSKTNLDALNDISTTQVLNQTGTALTNYGTSKTVDVQTQFNDIKGSSWSAINDTLHQIKLVAGTGGGGEGGTCDSAAIADAVWDELLAGHTTTGSAAQLVTKSVNTTLTCEAKKQ